MARAVAARGIDELQNGLNGRKCSGGAKATVRCWQLHLPFPRCDGAYGKNARLAEATSSRTLLLRAGENQRATGTELY